ncbi:MAG: exonuclease SbcCD subunit D [Mogibacterium sp.]|nr:exonuclease SbcCD subunit D [Mogibacterium sp.]
MKFIHIADLHLGKSVHGVSMIENGDQGYWVDHFIEVLRTVSPHAVLIAGDVFDRSAPSEDAIALFSRMMTAINDLGIPVMTVAGNHDSVHRLSYVGPVLSKQDLFFSRSLTNSYELEHVTITDPDNGEPVTFWLMPYVFPLLVARAMGDESLRDYDSAVRALLAAQPIDFSKRNVLIAHQNVTFNGQEVERGGSESMVGGVGQIDASAFFDFDYVALGHIHSAYPVGRESIRYAGTPLCYHFNETRQQQKGPVLVEMGPKGEPLKIETIVIEPLHPMREIPADSFENIRDRELENNNTGEYIKVTLNDRRVSPEIWTFFRNLYNSRGSILMELTSEYNQFCGSVSGKSSAVQDKSVEELFAEFYTERNKGEPPEEKDIQLMKYAGELMRNAKELNKVPEPGSVDALIDFLLKSEDK